MRNRVGTSLVTLVVMALGLISVMLVLAVTASAQTTKRVVNIGCGQSVSAIVNSDSASVPTNFVFSACTYSTSVTLEPEEGDEFNGVAGTFIRRGPAYDPEFGTSGGTIIKGSSTLDQVMKPHGTFRSNWIKIEGGDYDGTAGSGVGYAGGDTDNDTILYATRVANNEGAGVSNFHGHFWRSELTNNTTNPDALGHIGSGLKAVDEVGVVESYVHDTQGNGIWCDEECNDTDAVDNSKFTVWYTLIEGVGKDGVRWEKVGDEATSGEALIYLNEIHGNKRAGVGIRDARDADVRDNKFGAATIAGVSYPKNVLAWSATDSGRADRPNLDNIRIFDNARNGDAEKGCSEPDGIVACFGNTP